MTRKGGKQTDRGGGGGGGGRGGGGSGEVGPGNFFASLMGGAGGGDAADSISSSMAAAESMGYPGLGVGGAAPSPELLAQMFGAGAAEGAAGLVAAAPDDGIDKSRWHIIYPTYLDKKKSVAGGRRVSLAVAVQEPRVEEMKKICDHLQVPAAIEYWKRYPRDWLRSRGRLRVQFKNSSDGSLYNSGIPNKKALMQRMCELIPQLKSRSSGGGTAGAGAATSSTSGKKKKR